MSKLFLFWIVFFLYIFWFWGEKRKCKEEKNNSFLDHFCQKLRFSISSFQISILPVPHVLQSTYWSEITKLQSFYNSAVKTSSWKNFWQIVR